MQYKTQSTGTKTSNPLPSALFFVKMMVSMPLKQLKSAIEEKLAKIEREAEERDAKRRALKSGYPYIDLKLAPVQVDTLSMVPKEEAREAKLAVLARKRDKMVVAVYDPTLAATQKVIKKLVDQTKNVNVVIGSLSGLKHIWQYYELAKKELSEITGKVEINEKRLYELLGQLISLAAAEKTLREAVGAKANLSQVLEILLASALSLRGSDIHFEPEEKGVRFRLRIDGLLHDVFTGLPHADYFFILSRIKLLSAMKLNIHDAAQDGRFSIGLGAKTIEIRSSVLPSKHGETVVLRILDPETIKLSLGELGLRDDDLVLLNEELRRPNGMILNTGPTGSGKTTTLYAFLMQVNKPESKVITLEDPIEYRLPGIEQTQVDKEAGYTFANGLRSIVRQDPDVILVGEIRDFETAEIALNAALTGHLVFSTLHTNDSFGAIPRLIDLGAKSAIIGPSLNLVIAQRLIRRICEKCKKETTSSKELQDNIRAFLKKMPPRVPRARYEKYTIYSHGSCEACNGIGYKGRIAVLELLRVTDEINQLISKEVTEIEIKKVAVGQGVLTVQQSGILKVLEGVSTFEEVERVTGPISWQ